MPALVLSLTNAGLAAVQAASGSDPVTIAQLGLTATPFEVAPTLTALPGEFKRIAAISGTAAAANVTHMTAYDTSADVWNATGLGLWLADGTLFATFSAESTIINKAAPAFALVSFDIAWSADLAASIAFGDPLFTNPPATEEMRGLIELATQGEATTGTDVQRALTPAVARGAIVAWLLAQDGAGSGIDADLLDGQHGAWYADIAARLGFTPLDAAAYTAASVLARLITVDGAGSGLDADLLDGQHAAQLAPAGIIVMWSGSIASVPAGWHLCDGSSGTPDLRDRFVVGAGSTYTVGANGGAVNHNHAITVAGHALTVPELPAHNHAMFANVANDSDLTGATSVAVKTTSAPGESEYGLSTGGATPATLGLTASTGGGDAHAHDAGSANASSLPPYFALAYIMKL